MNARPATRQRNRIRTGALLAAAALVSCSNPTDSTGLRPPEGVAAVLVSPTSVRVSWQAADGADHYDVYGGPQQEGVLYRGSSTTLSYTDSPAASGTAYYYRVVSINGQGASFFSAPAMVMLAPAPPETLYTKPGDGAVTVIWLNRSQGSAIIFVARDSVIVAGTQYDSVRVPSSSYTVTNLTNDQKYWFSVSMVSGSTVSARSRSLPAIPRALLPPTAGMKLIPGGTFTMGTMDSVLHNRGISMQTFNYPAHQVTLSPFYMDSTEVTQNDYMQLMGHNPGSNGSATIGWLTLDHGSDFLRAVDVVSWFDAARFCNARSKHEGFDTVYVYTGVRCSVSVGAMVTDTSVILLNTTVDYSRNGYRLPTEAEWEYACRGNATTLFYWGDDSSSATVDQYEWIINAGGQASLRVAQKKPNPFGLYDMIGNVSEWCNDWFAPYSAEPRSDPTGPAAGANRVARGPGGTVTFALSCYATGRWRAGTWPENRYGGSGFRCVRPAR